MCQCRNEADLLHVMARTSSPTPCLAQISVYDEEENLILEDFETALEILVGFSILKSGEVASSAALRFPSLFESRMHHTSSTWISLNSTSSVPLILDEL